MVIAKVTAVYRASLLVAILLALPGCQDGPEVGATIDGKADGFESFEDFRDSLYCEPDSEVCLVQGDVPVVGEDALRAIYAKLVGGGQALSVQNIDSVDKVWDTVARQSLRYCVSAEFGDRRAEVIGAIGEAAGDWEQIAHVDFIHAEEEDGGCTDRNPRVLFDVAPSPDGAYYFARAFFPNNERKDRRVRINFTAVDESLSSDRFGGRLTLRGILRHELGHVLGFRHEHIRPENEGNFFCREDENFRPITEYDSRSVMHYPQCDGEGDWSLELTEIDIEGARFFYPDISKYRAARCEVEVDSDNFVNDDCEPIVREIVELANTGSFDLLDNWVKLDRRAAEEIVELRKTNPFKNLDELRDEVRYLGEATVRKMYNYLYVSGRCPQELDSEGRVDVRCRPVVHRILDLANNAPEAELDDDVSLDSRAVGNIDAIRHFTPFTSIADLWAVPYVKNRALGKMYDYLFAP